MLTLLPLAFAAAVYPTLLAGVVTILTRPEPKPLLVSFLAGGWVMSVSCGLAIVFVLDGVVSASARRSASPGVYLIAGILSLILAAALWRRHQGGHSTATTTGLRCTATGSCSSRTT